MGVIGGGQFADDEFREDEIHGPAFEDLKRIFSEWDRPKPSWPDGTTFSEPKREHDWQSRTTWATLPGGRVRYQLLLDRPKESDPRPAPQLIWSIEVEPNGAIFARPRVANMSVTVAPKTGDELSAEGPPRQLITLGQLEREAFAGVPLGLKPRYEVGRLPLAITQTKRVVSVGWRY